MSLVGQWDGIAQELPEDWGDARLSLLVKPLDVDRAAALLGPLNPGRRGGELLFSTARRGAGFGPDQLRRLLHRLDEERLGGTLELLATDAPPAAAAEERPSLAAGWDALLTDLPDDWSDLYCELELTWTGYLERAALLMGPLNPVRHGDAVGLRFRVAHRQGYGASAEMARRCFQRLDEDGIPGRLEIVHALSDTRPVGTQGPVWRVGGRSV